MVDLLTRLEITKLAHELHTDEAELELLADLDHTELRELRQIVSAALFVRHEDRVRRLAQLSRLLPVPVTSKIAKLALGPMLSARVAAVLEAREAAKLATHLGAEFLTELALSLDPSRVADIVRALPDDLVVDVGRRLLARGEHLVLARFVSVVTTDVALRVMEVGTGADLLQVSLFTDDRSALDAIVTRLTEDTLAELVREAAATESYDAAATVLDSLSEANVARLVAQLPSVDEAHRAALSEAVANRS